MKVIFCEADEPGSLSPSLPPLSCPKPIRPSYAFGYDGCALRSVQQPAGRQPQNDRCRPNSPPYLVFLLRGSSCSFSRPSFPSSHLHYWNWDDALSVPLKARQKRREEGEQPRTGKQKQGRSWLDKERKERKGALSAVMLYSALPPADPTDGGTASCLFIYAIMLTGGS